MQVQATILQLDNIPFGLRLGLRTAKVTYRAAEMSLRTPPVAQRLCPVRSWREDGSDVADHHQDRRKPVLHGMRQLSQTNDVRCRVFYDSSEGCKRR